MIIISQRANSVIVRVTQKKVALSDWMPSRQAINVPKGLSETFLKIYSVFGDEPILEGGVLAKMSHFSPFSPRNGPGTKEYRRLTVI